LTDATTWTGQEGVEAVLCLLNEADPGALYEDICGVVAAWETRPTYFAEHLAPLNVLIDIGRFNPGLLDQLAGKLGFKVPPAELEVTETIQSNRNRYQRAYMRARRHRLALAVALEAANLPTLPIERKGEIEDQIRQRWREERRSFLELKGELSWKERNRASAEFWENIDERLSLGSWATKEPRVVAVDVESLKSDSESFDTTDSERVMKQELYSTFEMAGVELWEIAYLIGISNSKLHKIIEYTPEIFDPRLKIIFNKLKSAIYAHHLPLSSYTNYNNRQNVLRKLLR